MGGSESRDGWPKSPTSPTLPLPAIHARPPLPLPLPQSAHVRLTIGFLSHMHEIARRAGSSFRDLIRAMWSDIPSTARETGPSEPAASDQPGTDGDLQRVLAAAAAAKDNRTPTL